MDDCIELFSDVERRRAIESPIPVFTSDNWDPFEEGLLNVCGFLETPPYCGIGRKPEPLLVPYPNLKYAKVCKKRKNGRLLGRHTHALDFFQAWYNFAKPHKSLRLRVDLGRKKWMQRTPAMAEGLTDHIWTIKELMAFRILVQ